MKEYPFPFVVRFQAKHKNIIKKGSKRLKISEAAFIRQCVESSVVVKE